jgi:predicted SprT family Zn-dependent metalloprotease
MSEHDEAASRLGAEFETAVVRELLSQWRQINTTYFRSVLHPPVIELSSAEGRLGRWDGALRTIQIGRQLVMQKPWGVVLEVLKHEMAHQYVHEALRETQETAHGPAFRQVCQRLGIDGTAAGLPASVVAAAENEGEQRILQRIARLLALAESSNMHEAEAAMSAAQRLMLKYNLEVAPSAGTRDYGFRHLGQPKGRITESERVVASILNQHFFVETIWVSSYLPLEGRHGSVLEACGTHANLELAAYVHSFLTQTAERLWVQHQREHRIRSNRDRRSFLSGVMLGFKEKLDTQNRENQKEGLVWVKDADLQGFYRRRHPHIRYTRLQGNQRTEAYDHGKEAGRKIVLHRPVEHGGTGGHLLSSGK